MLNGKTVISEQINNSSIYKYSYTQNHAPNPNYQHYPPENSPPVSPTHSNLHSYLLVIPNSDTHLRKVNNFEEKLKKKPTTLKRNCSGHNGEIEVEAKRRRRMLLCGKASINGTVSGSVPVYLNVYDLTTFNGYAYWLGLGVYHSGVQVHGVEYAFGAHEQESTGIFEGDPRKCEGFRFRKTILIGKTDKEFDEVREVMEKLGGEYKGNAYNLITKNCNHFCNDACLKLTGNSIPSWVNRLARIGFICNCVIPVSLNSTKVRHHRIEDKQCEEEKQIKQALTSESNKVTVSNSTPSASPSPAPSTSSGLRRGRSRTRRPLPPPSPLIVASSSS